MAKLSSYNDEKALDKLADLLEPLAEILNDQSIKAAYKSKAQLLQIAKLAIKNHKRAIIEVLAILDDVPIEEYHVNIFTLPAKVLEILNDPDFMQLFTLQGQMNDGSNSGSATVENIKVSVQ